MNQTKILIALAFLAGYFVSDIINDGANVIQDANAQSGIQRVVICNTDYMASYCGNQVVVTDIY